MRISHKNKFVFIANQKTASSAIRFALDDYSEIQGVDDVNSEYYYHTTANKLKKYFEKMNWDWDQYFKFAFVRNPYDLAVSHFFYRTKLLNKNLKNSSNPWLIDFFEESYTPIGFSNWIKKIDGKLTYIDGNVSNQINMVSDETGNCIVDFVGKYENINEDFNFIRSKLNFNCKDLEFKNKSYHNHYSYYYDSESIDIIRRRYKSDIDFFGFDYSDEH